MGQLLTSASRLPVCGNCLNSFARIAETICSVCGLALDAEDAATSRDTPVTITETLCSVCCNQTFHFDRVRSFARYRDALVQVIILLKVEELQPFGGLVCGSPGRAGAAQRPATGSRHCGAVA